MDVEHIYCIKDITNNKAPMKILLIVSAVCFIFMVIELVGGILANSLAIMTDAAHLFSDISGFFISIFSIWIGSI